MSDLAFASATRLVAALARKELSSTELLDYYLERVARLNLTINAVVVLDEERAREAARAADEAIAAGRSLGPLHGLPMTVKECFDAAGMRTTCGAPAFADNVSSHDADAVARLRAAGAVVFGKTNLPIWCREGQAFNEVYGTTSNPWDLSRGPGGSSGGSAAALAAGLTGLELGSDIAGSIRNPAHTCGVYGLKPSRGVVSQRGILKTRPGALAPRDLVLPGPLARSADDLELALDVLAGPIEEDRTAWRLELPPPRSRELADFRVAAWLDDPWAPVDATVLELLQDAVSALERAGARVERRPGPVALETSDRLYRHLLMGALSTGLADEAVAGIDAGLAQLPPAAGDLGARHRRGLVQRHRDWLGADEERWQMRRQWAGFFQDYDVLVCPVWTLPAIPHDQSPDLDARVIEVNGVTRPYWDLVTWAGIANLLGLPAASVPIGRTRGDGLPVGLQIIGPYLEDRTVIEFARHVAQHVPGFEAPPGFRA
ncbi:amidase [Amycolatopsis balhimycina DSM 5908]|uniref:Amidase n=1 Tax=Amycolatopsis balhimycina DSM 5908 TaxID=1081091 RepID=A0A428WJJ4_AMYBA|nr:amidase [Amycolatopsis balhimycina]RSM43216.1 amidase [Amycolatopsis balhimycina DSM 5908]